MDWDRECFCQRPELGSQGQGRVNGYILNLDLAAQIEIQCGKKSLGDRFRVLAQNHLTTPLWNQLAAARECRRNLPRDRTVAEIKANL